MVKEKQSPPLFKLQGLMHYVQHYPINSQSQLETRALVRIPGNTRNPSLPDLSPTNLTK